MPEHLYRFPRSHRLGGKLRFAAVRAGGLKDSRGGGGPLAVYALPNRLEHCVLGISIGRHVGNAVVRNRIKRMLREAFRLTQHEWPKGYDLVVSVRRHRPMELGEYQRILGGAVARLHGEWGKKK